MGDVLKLPAPARPTTAQPTAEPATQPAPLWRELVGPELRAERRARGERLADVADRAGVSMQYLSEVERGLKDPSSEILQAVTSALGLSLGQLLIRVVAAAPVAPRISGPVCRAA